MKTKNKIYIVSAFFSLSSLALLLFLVFPTINKIKAYSDDFLSKKRSTDTLKIQAIEVDKFKKNYDIYKPNLEKIDQLFIDKKSPVYFIEFLEKTAFESGIHPEISLSPYSLEETEEEEGKTIITFQFFSSGDYLSILKFTKLLETGPYLVQIKNLTIKNSESESLSAGNFSGKVDAAFLITVFAQSQEE
ncbi:MAG: hypothetical protein HYT36_02955 [Candidatus Staskawiczbacteria bacterium]|nr:hypothetical protein [Candidatus Staskawiczbacteria bacterium]